MTVVLAILDCAEPVQWILVRSERASDVLTKLVHIATLRAISDRPMSSDCTEEFVDIVRSYGLRLLDLSYGLLRERALDHRMM